MNLDDLRRSLDDPNLSDKAWAGIITQIANLKSLAAMDSAADEAYKTKNGHYFGEKKSNQRSDRP